MLTRQTLVARRKLPGHHNRRYKGKRRDIDLAKQYREEAAHQKNLLPMRLRAMFIDIKDHLGELELEFFVDAMWSVHPSKITTMWYSHNTVFIVTHEKTICLELEDAPEVIVSVFGDGVDARCVFWTSEHCAKWLKKRVQDEKKMGYGSLVPIF